MWYLDELLFPAYKQQRIKPVIIIGQPRSGTSFMHRTLAKDEKNFFAVRHIEWRYPYITIQKLVGLLNLADKLKNTSYWPDNKAGRKAAKMHRDTLYDYEEDGIFYEECFLHHFFIFLRFPYPDLFSYLDDFPALPDKVQEHIIDTHRKVVQKISYLRGGNTTYLSKEVTSHNKMDRILKLYPEAKFIVLARKSGDYLNSLLELVRNSTKAKNDVDPYTVPGWESVFVERMQRDSILLIDLLEHRIDRENQIRISYERLLDNIELSINYIYARLGRTLSRSYLPYIEEVTQKQQNRDSGYQYENRQFEGFERFDTFVSEVNIEHQSALTRLPSSESVDKRSKVS
jgi:hypothetical protein